jgi:hypothetical protein
MHRRPLSIFQVICRGWWRLQGERPLIITFWPSDYRRGSIHEIEGQNYYITRYFRAIDGRFFEVWGRRI